LSGINNYGSLTPSQIIKKDFCDSKKEAPKAKDRILLIDDEIFNLKALKSLISLSIFQLGYDKKKLEDRIDLASNGQEALQMVHDLHNSQR
jgi:hypothetical protein